MTTKPSEYNTYGVASHSEIAKELQISTSLSAKIEGDVFLKFSLNLFQPPWNVKDNGLRHLKDAAGNPVRFDVGAYSDILAEVVRSVVGSSDVRAFKMEYERRIVEISRHPEFRKFLVALINPNLDEAEVK